MLEEPIDPQQTVILHRTPKVNRERTKQECFIEGDLRKF